MYMYILLPKGRYFWVLARLQIMNTNLYTHTNSRAKRTVLNEWYS